MPTGHPMVGPPFRFAASARPSVPEDAKNTSQGGIMIILGLVLLLLGFLLKIQILWTVGIILLVIGAILVVLGAIGRPVAGRRHFF
jgi:uncharacterized membrane protein HdeD (DUF308 family)